MRWLSLLLILLIAFPSLAQESNENCGNGLPCGSLPWTLPEFPDMPSPTPIDASAIIEDGSVGPPEPTSTPFADLSPVEDGIATVQAALDATPILVDIEGTPMSPEDIVTGYVGQSGELFGYIKGLNTNSLGVLAPFVTFSVTVLLVVLVTQLNTFIIPIALSIFGMIRKLLSLILDFLPF